MNYFELEPEQNTFSNIVVDLTHRCNMECANCYIPNRDVPDLDKEKLFEFLSRLPSRTYIRLIGAEPTMRNDLPEIISKVKALGHRPSVTTNGLKLAQSSYVKKLKDAGLRLLLHSMNGADDDEAYKELDNGKWATVKVRALDNIFAERLPINTGTIIARGVNEYVMNRQVEVFAERAIANGINFNTTPPYNKITPVLRMKSVGMIGRYMEGVSYTIDELTDMAVYRLGIDKSDIIKTSAGVVKAGPQSGEALTSYMFPYETEAGKVLIRLIDWQTDDDGVIDHDNPNRGRLTENFTVAPFFEHVKKNEYGY
jgi:uncharacterized Fe-S cluster-containing radical SAM superfamily protein|tara:strand:+ start:188 stop:1123 length:936 start_codon:yes stop_codon:yes gene_type:complete